VKHLDRYIFILFFKYFVTLTTGFITLYILIDFSQKIDNFMDKGKSMGLVIRYFLLHIPFILEQMGPVCILLAGVITLGLLNHSNELLALKSCGLPLRRITRPILLAGTAGCLLLLLMSQFVVPGSVAETNRIWNQEVKGKVPLGIYRNGRYYYRSKEGFYSFVRPHPSKNHFYAFSFSSWDPSYHLTTLVSANLAIWANDKWALLKGQIQERAGEETFTADIFRGRHFDFPDQPDDFFVPEYHSLELSLTGLFVEAKQEDGMEGTRAWTEFYGRIFYTLLGLPLLLLGLPLLLIVYRRWGRDLSLAIPVSSGLAFACWGGWSTLQSLAKAGYVSPFLASSSVHLLIGLFGIYLLLREDF
jgi:lipopolysaccharide export system permease protein